MDRLKPNAPAIPRPLSPNLHEVARQFRLGADIVRVEPHGNGHINDTFAITCQRGGSSVRFILQRINQNVFRDVPALMENIKRVTEHAARKTAALPAAERVNRQILTIVPTLAGTSFHRDPAGHCWRCYHFVEHAQTYDVLLNPGQAREAAYAFGRFQVLLADLGGARLHETIPNFHHTRRRFDTLRSAIAANRQGRAGVARAEIAFALEREGIVDVLSSLQRTSQIPERITHNDTKLNNVMLADDTGLGVCVIDLDTVMPGLSLYDFGDLVRFAANSAAEDETDLTRVEVNLPVFAAIVEGYLAGTRGLLNPVEIDHLAISARLITFEIGMRFLTDFLEGDTYFKTKRPAHNLDRCRCQFALLRSMEAQVHAMEALVKQLAR